MRRPTRVKRAAILVATCLGIVRAHADPASVDRDRLLNAAAEPANWLAKGGDWRGEYFSALTRINTDNVGSLGVAWDYDATPHRGRVLRGMEATPVVVDGVLYTSLAWSEVVALDAATGRELWRYDPKVEESADHKGCCDGVNRGVAVWKGRLYVGTMDGFLVAVDARDGHELWRTDTLIDHKRSYTITGAPQVAGRVVVIGNSGSEFGVRGYVSAYDLDTGALRWRFYTVPGDPKLGFEHPELKWAAKTWSPQSDWVTGGGGTVWDGMAYDPQLNLLYFGTANSNPYPNWFRSPGNSDNLFLASILALDPDTGRLKWHYQATPGEMWDYDATQPLVLADLQLEGRSRKVLMQANKNGFFYVLDRATGKLLSAKDYVYVNWASRVDLKTGRPVLTGQGWYKDEPKLIFPAQTGGHNWMPMSYDPQTGLVYIPTIDTPMLFTAAPTYQFHIGEFNMGAGGAFPPVADQYLDPKHPAEMREQLTAWDPVAQREVWKVPLGGFFNGGVLSTAGGLVFQGTSGGHFIAYDARNGHTLRDIELGTGIMAAASTFTGSTATGRQLMVSSGQSTMKPLLLECGGKSPNIVFDDCPDLDAVADAVTARMYWNQGQVCTAGSRLLVQDSIKEQLLERIQARARALIPGDPFDPDTTCGPLISAPQMNKVLGYIQSGLEQGGKLLIGGQPTRQETGGYFIETTIFDDVRPDMRIGQEEIFGPVLAVMTFRDAEEACKLANSTTYGLSATVWTRSVSRIHLMMKKLRAGEIDIKATARPSAGPPFASMPLEPHKQSGIGVEGGIEGLQSYTILRAIKIYTD